jgi:GNAT superfamily N-acetyltransferase
MNSYGLVFGGEKTSHDSGNDIAYNVVSGNDYTKVVIEGDEYILPKEAMQSEKVYDFVDKLPIEMLDEIKRSENVFIQFPNLRQGDMVVCKNSVRNDDLHTIKGTAKEIGNYLQGLSACRMYAKGGYISGELANGGGVEDESQLRLLTPMPPTKLGKTGIDSLTEIVGKDELREVMSGALYAGKGRIVATDAYILVVLENQNYPKSLEGTIKSLWNKVPQERLIGIPYPNWEAVVPNQQNFQTKELSIDDVLAYAYGGFLEGKNIIKEKDFNKYEKEKFKYVLRLNIGNIEIGIDSLLLTRILRTLKANDVRKVVFHIGQTNQRPIKITTDNKHYGLIMPVMIADKVEDLGEGIYVSQQIFYPISDKDFRAMSKKYGEYLTEFSKMVGGGNGNQIPTEYNYLATLRPISQAYPKENLIRLEQGGYNGYGIAVYSKPLSIKEIEHFSFFPATEIEMIGTKIYYYEDFVAEIKTDINTIYLSKDIGGGEIEMELMSPTKFLEKIKSGQYRPLNEMAEGGEITINVPLLLRVLELAKEEVKEDKELHFIAERLQTLSKKGTLTMEDYDYISGLESNDKIQKLIAENDSNDSNLRFEQGGEIEDLISRGIVDLKMTDTTPKHAKEYGLQSLNPLFVQTICVSESKRLKGLGKKALSYIEKYAIENGHDLIFGHIIEKAKFTKDQRKTFFCDIDMIKNWLHSNGYSINDENNDFHKVIQSNKLENGGGVLLAPNGKPSNLTPEQWHLVRTPEFKAWFGDWEALENAKTRDKGMDEVTLKNLASDVSKVVDENGEPLMLWHGSRSLFYVFDIEKGGQSNPISRVGFWFTPIKSFASNFAKSIWYGSSTNVFLQSCFLNFKNPKIYKSGLPDGNKISELDKKIKELQVDIDMLFNYWNDDWENRKLFDYSLQGFINNKNYEHYSLKTKDAKSAIDNGMAAKKLYEEKKSLINEKNDLIFSDSYEKFRADIYKLQGKTSYDANVGGLGMALDDVQKAVYDYKNALKEEKYDGIIVLQTKFDKVVAGVFNDQYVALYPEQIKLANGSNTTFDSNNPDIRFEKGGGVEDEINPEQIRAEIEALGEVLKVLEGEDRQLIQDEVEILKLALGELEYTKLLAPNGKPSNLTPEQWHLVRTPEFKAWFGDWENSPQTASKVVDENGEPLVVFREIKATEKNYFNTEVENFAISQRWQTNLDEILTRKLPSETKVGDEVSGFNKRGVVTEINNGIFKIKYEDGSVFSGNAFGLTFYGEKKPKKVISAFLNIRILGGNEKLFVHSFGVQKDSGILSISPDYKTYFTFRSNQVKLADGSNTTFDSNNPDIRFEKGGMLENGVQGEYDSLYAFLFWHKEYIPIFAKKYGISESEWEDFVRGELGYDEEILQNILGDGYKLFYDEEKDMFEVSKKTKRKKSGNYKIERISSKNEKQVLRIINDQILTELKPRLAVFWNDMIVGGSTYEFKNGTYKFDLAILPDYQGLGLSKGLIQSIIDDAKMLKAKSLEAEVVNKKLLSYLKSIGFSAYKSQGQDFVFLSLK